MNKRLDLDLIIWNKGLVEYFEGVLWEFEGSFTGVYGSANILKSLDPHRK